MAIMMPEKKQSALSRLAGPGGALLGAGIGTLIAPGAGTMAGAQMGGAAGGAVSGIENKDPSQVLGALASGAGGAGSLASGAGGAPAQAQPAALPPMSPMQRRQATWNLGGNWRF